jgi:hypothetical protein
VDKARAPNTLGMEVVNGVARTERRVAGSLIFGCGGSEELKKRLRPSSQALDIYVEECSVSWKSMIADWKITSQRAQIMSRSWLFDTA